MKPGVAVPVVFGLGVGQGDVELKVGEFGFELAEFVDVKQFA